MPYLPAVPTLLPHRFSPLRMPKCPRGVKGRVSKIGGWLAESLWRCTGFLRGKRTHFLANMTFQAIS